MKIKKFLFTVVLILLCGSSFAQTLTITSQTTTTCDVTVCATLIDHCTAQECSPAQQVCITIPKHTSGTWALSLVNCMGQMNSSCWQYDLIINTSNCDSGSDGSEPSEFIMTGNGSSSWIPLGPSSPSVNLNGFTLNIH